MYVFGGWVPLVVNDSKTPTAHEKEWKCTNTLAVLDLESMCWEDVTLESNDDNVPRARAGHSAVGIHTRLYVWSGRDGYRKAWNNQVRVCCKDLWYLEVKEPPAPQKVALVRASTHSLEVSWTGIPFAAAYHLQVQIIEPASQTPVKAIQTHSHHPAGTSILQQPQGTKCVQMVRPVQYPALTPLTPLVVNSPPPPLAAAASSQQPDSISPDIGLSSSAVASAHSQVVTAVQSPTLPSSTTATLVVAPLQSNTTPTPTTSSIGCVGVNTSSPVVSTPVTVATMTKHVRPIITTVPAGSNTVTMTGGTNLTPQTLRVVTNTGAPLRIISSGQTIRLAATTPATSQAILKTVTSLASSGGQPSTGATTTTIGGKQYIIQKPITLGGQNLQFHLVKSAGSAGMTLQALPKLNVVKSGVSISGSQTVIQTQAAGGNNSVQKTAVVAGNYVKLVSQSAKPIIMKNANMLQVSKLATTTSVGGKPAFVITNKQGQQLRTNQQIIIVTTASNIRTVPAGGVVTTAGTNIVSIVNTTTPTTTVTSASATTGTALKMIRGRPLAFNLQTGVAKNTTQILQQLPPKTISLRGKPVTLQMTSHHSQTTTSQGKTLTIVSSANSIVQTTAGVVPQTTKLVMLPSGKKNIVNIFGQQTKIQQNQRSSADSSSAEALIALANEASFLQDSSGTINEHIDQMDGGGDYSIEGDDCESLNSDSEETASEKRLMSIKQPMFKPGVKINKMRPKYIKMGLFGGSPTPTPTPPTLSQAITSLIKGEETEQNDYKPQSGQNEPEPTLSEIQSAEHESTEDGSNDGRLEKSGEVEETTKVKRQSSSSSILMTNIDEDNSEDRQRLLELKQKDTPQHEKEENQEEYQHDPESHITGADDINSQQAFQPSLSNSRYDLNNIGPIGQLLHDNDDSAHHEEQHRPNIFESTLEHPTPTETEAANILTTIKCGELLQRQNQSYEDIHPSQFEQQHNLRLTSPPPENFFNRNNYIQPSPNGRLDALASAALLASNEDFSPLNEPALSSTPPPNISENTLEPELEQPEVEEKGTENVVMTRTRTTSSINLHNNCTKRSDGTMIEDDENGEPKWFTVGFFKNTLAHTVTGYVDPTQWNTSMVEDMNSDTIPDLSSFCNVNLEPGVAYRFRLAALNSVGHGPWAEVACFKTCLPGYPGAPSAIKISKSPEGAHLSWEPPPAQTGEIFEYSVYLAVKSLTSRERVPPAQLAFVRVYCGPNNQCVVQSPQLQNAHVDCSNKPAIIFRIAARNEKGYGPATQVRWLQDPSGGANKMSSSSSGSSKRSHDKSGGGTSKRSKNKHHHQQQQPQQQD